MTLKFTILKAFSYRRCAAITRVHGREAIAGYHQHIFKWFLGGWECASLEHPFVWYERLILKRMVNHYSPVHAGRKSHLRLDDLTHKKNKKHGKILISPNRYKRPRDMGVYLP